MERLDLGLAALEVMLWQFQRQKLLVRVIDAQPRPGGSSTHRGLRLDELERVLGLAELLARVTVPLLLRLELGLEFPASTV